MESVLTSWPLVLILIFSIIHRQNWIPCVASTTLMLHLSRLHLEQSCFLGLDTASASSQVCPRHNANRYKSDTSSLA